MGTLKFNSWVRQHESSDCSSRSHCFHIWRGPGRCSLWKLWLPKYGTCHPWLPLCICTGKCCIQSSSESCSSSSICSFLSICESQPINCQTCSESVAKDCTNCCQTHCSIYPKSCPCPCYCHSESSCSSFESSSRWCGVQPVPCSG